MLPDEYHWIQTKDGAVLQFYAASIARVRRMGVGWKVTITFHQRGYSGACANLEDGKRYVERWLAVRSVAGLGGGQTT